MSHMVLQQNLKRLIKEKKYQISEIEKKAGLKRNNVYDIIKGNSKRPSADILQALADALGVTVKDLLNSQSEQQEFLSHDNMDLLLKVTQSVIDEIKDQELQLTASQIISIINEAYNYSFSSNGSIPDKKFIKWILHQKYSQKLT